MNQPKYNIIIIGVSYSDGMASSTRVRNLLEPLISKNLINASNLIYKKDAFGIINKNGAINNVNYRVIGFCRSNPLSIIPFICIGIHFINKNRSRIQKNILYNYSYPDIKNILFILYAKLIGYKVILDITEDNRYHTKLSRFLTKLKIASSLFFIKHASHFTDGILAISDHLYKHMSKISRGNIPVYHIPISVDLNKFERKTYQIPTNFKIFYGGSFGEKDGLEYLIKAFEDICLKFKNLSLILTGRGNEHDMGHLYQLIDNSSIKDKIIFKDYLSKDEYYNLLNECDIFCITRVNSNFANAGFPFKLGEFLATGKSTIATNIGDIDKYLKNGCNALLINPSSVEEIVKALKYLLKNQNQINIIGMEGRKTAEYYFDSEKISMNLFQIFESL